MKWYEILWQLPQWIIGMVYLFLHEGRLVNGFTFNKVRYYVLEGQKGSITFCKDYVFLSTFAQRSDYTIKHEYGHTKQSDYLGWLYLIIIGLPSIIWAFVHSMFLQGKRYYDFPTERWADKLGGNKA